MTESDGAAIARTLSGDGDGFRVLVERYSPGVFRLAFRMTGNESDAEDVVQETMLRAYKNLANYDGRASFSTWLYRIGANYTIDLLNSRRRRNERAWQPDSDDSGPAWEPAATAPGPDRLAAGGQLQARLTIAMQQLSPQERSAFVLRHCEEFSVEEIASTLNVAPGAARHSIFRAVQKLRRGLAAFVEAPQ
jgi:RNA polymerase sigma-70 factor (ECF subfamily)